MKTVKITKREKFNQIIDILNGVEGTEDLVACIENEIALMDKKAAKAKETAAAKKAKADELLPVIQDALTDEFATIDEIVARIDFEDITNSKAATRLNALVREGVAEKGQVKVPGVEGQKTRTLVAYKIVND